MADPTASPDPEAGAGSGPPRTPTTRYPGTPRWVKVSGLVVLVLALLVFGAMVAGGGQHGPGRHAPAGAPGGLGGAEGHTLPVPAVQPA